MVYSAVPGTEETLDTETAKAEEKKKRKIKIPFDERRFYIPKEKLEKATSLYGPFKGNPIVLAVVLVILFFVCQKAIEILPSLIDMM